MSINGCDKHPIYNALFAIGFTNDSITNNVYSGLVQAQNALNTIMNCFIVFGLVSFTWIFVGFSLAYEGDYLGIMDDLLADFLNGINGVNTNGIPQLLNIIYQMIFTLIASAVITGSLVGRVKLSVLAIFLSFRVFWSMLFWLI